MNYSLDFRRKVLAIKKEKGLSIRETAKRFCIGSATVSRWIKQINPTPAASRSIKIDKSALEKDVIAPPINKWSKLFLMDGAILENIMDQTLK